MSETVEGKSGVPSAHRPETEGEVISVAEVKVMLERKRDRLKQVIVRAGEVKADAQQRIVDARAELVETERLLKAMRPRGSK